MSAVEFAEMLGRFEHEVESRQRAHDRAEWDRVPEHDARATALRAQLCSAFVRAVYGVP